MGVRRGCCASDRWGDAIAGVALLTSSTALARTPALPRLELEWDAPRVCPDRDAARGAIEAALGTGMADGRGSAVVRVKITETGSGRFAADIWMYDPTGSGERSFEGADCTQVMQAAALIVAFALKPDHDADSTTLQAEPVEKHRAAATETLAHDRASFAVGVRVAGDIGSLPQVDPGLALLLELRYGQLSAEVAGSAWLPRTTYGGPVPGSGGEFALYTGALRGCFDLTPAKRLTWSLGPCAGAEAGMTTGSGVGTSISPRRSTHAFWGAGLFGLSLRYLGASPLAFGILAELGVPVHRAEWQIDNFGRTIFQPAALIGRGSLGVSWQFP